MTEDISKYKNLKSWLLLNGVKPFYSVNVHVNSDKSSMTAKALCDLHNLMSQESDVFISDFFIGLRKRIKAEINNPEVKNVLEAQNWPPETD